MAGARLGWQEEALLVVVVALALLVVMALLLKTRCKAAWMVAWAKGRVAAEEPSAKREGGGA